MSKKCGIFGGTDEFFNFLNKVTSGSVIKFAFADEALLAAENGDISSLFILPKYDEGEETLPCFSENNISRLGHLRQKSDLKVFIENYVSEGIREYSILGANVVEKQKYFCREYIRLSEDVAKETGAELMQSRSGYYLPARNEYGEVLIDIVNCIGTHKVIGSAQNLGAGLVKMGNFYSSYFTFTKFDGLFMLPYSRWKKIYGAIVSEITGENRETAENAFDNTFVQTVKTDNIYIKREGMERNRALEKSIEKVLNWHLSSGVMPENSGELGIYEMFNSSNLHLLRNRRVDANFFTATLFVKAGKYFNNEKYIEIGKNIVNFLYDTVKFQILDGENKGVIKWYDDNCGLGCTITYASDSCRCGINMIELLNLTGDERLLESAKLLGELILKWFGGQSLLACSRFDYSKTDTLKIQKDKNDFAAPEFHEAPAVFLKKLYEITGDERYKNQLKNTGDTFAEIYPDYTIGSALSKNFTYSRLLGLLAAASDCTGANYSGVINELLCYFTELSHPCGGVGDKGAYVPEDAGDKLLEFAVGFGEGHDSISDVLYCCNTLLAALSILQKNKFKGIDMEKVSALYGSVTDFLLNIQIKSDDVRLDGAWMRAFDMENEEYYGCHKDFGWGPYCLLSGWVMGAIPLIFLGMLGEGYIY